MSAETPGSERDTEALAGRLLGAWMSLSAARVEQSPLDHCRDLARNLIGSPELAAYVARKVEAVEQERDEAQAEASDVGHDYDRRGERLWRLAALAGWTPGNESDNDATAEAYVTDALTQSRAVIERVTALRDEYDQSVIWRGWGIPQRLTAALAPATEPASDRPDAEEATEA